MGHNQVRNKPRVTIVDPELFGVSFSLKQCREFKLDQKDALTFLIQKMGFRRFRLMSYWDEHEKTRGNHDFSLLDEQIQLIEKSGGVITLCLGARQPRWPENHWPDWAWKLDRVERSVELLKYVAVVVNRYKDLPTVISWQLENEALLKSFGERSEVIRKRLRSEYLQIKTIDKTRPVIMTTSTSWGIPLRKPIPDTIGFSYYVTLFNEKLNRYTSAFHFAWLQRFKAFVLKMGFSRTSFIHELQAEPWGPKAIWEMPISEQNKSMSVEQLEKNITLAKKTKLYPIDLWGGEWWYWRFKRGDRQISDTVSRLLS